VKEVAVSPGTITLAVACSITLLAPAARADIAPPPGTQERAAAALIREHGHACARVTRLSAAPREEADVLFRRGLDASTATCDTGKQYVVAFPRRMPGPPRPDAPPPATPVVRPLP
jgi:hypothetical protein